jgi:hypothetical protein
MSWTYSGDPATSTRDEIRFLIGDTDSTQDWTMSDEEVNYIATQSTNTLLCAAIGAENVASKFARLAQSKSVGDLSVTWGDRRDSFTKLALNLRARASLKVVPIYVGGLSRAEKAAVDADTDRVQPAFKVDGMTRVSVLTPSDTSGV